MIAELAQVSLTDPLTSWGRQGYGWFQKAGRSGPSNNGGHHSLQGYAVADTPIAGVKIMRKITRKLHRAFTTRRAMPEIWFDLVLVANIAVPFSMWTGNHNMLLIAAALEFIAAAWYILGHRPVRKATRRAVTTSRTRTRSARRTSRKAA
jgi:hypothetical protein